MIGILSNNEQSIQNPLLKPEKINIKLVIQQINKLTITPNQKKEPYC
jgi:hypothetical protein